MEDWRIIVTASGSEILLAASFGIDSYSIAFTSLIEGCPVSCIGYEQVCTPDDVPVFSNMYNPSIEGKTSDIIIKLKSVTLNESNPMKTTFTLTGNEKDELRSLSLSCPLSPVTKFAFTWRFDGSLLSSDKYCDIFIKPMFKLTSIISEQNVLLMKTIKKKEMEIEEHKANGSVIKRGHLETKTFDNDLFHKESLRSSSVVSAVKNPATNLFSKTEVVKAMNWIHCGADEVESGSSANSSPSKNSPSKASKRALGKSVDELLRVVENKNVEMSDNTEELQEQERRKQLQKITKQPHPKKKKTKSVF